MGPPDVGSKWTTCCSNLPGAPPGPLWGLDIFVEVIEVIHSIPSVAPLQPLLAGIERFEIGTNLHELGIDRGEIETRTAETPVKPLLRRF
jgi:hypothetical protein